MKKLILLVGALSLGWAGSAQTKPEQKPHRSAQQVPQRHVPMQHSIGHRAAMRMVRRGHGGRNWQEIHMLQRRIVALRKEAGRLSRQHWAEHRGKDPRITGEIRQLDREIAMLQRQIAQLKAAR